MDKKKERELLERYNDGKVDVKRLISMVVLKGEKIHELQTFKSHAEFTLPESMYEKLDSATEKHLNKERAFR